MVLHRLYFDTLACISSRETKNDKDNKKQKGNVKIDRQKKPTHRRRGERSRIYHSVQRQHKEPASSHGTRIETTPQQHNNTATNSNSHYSAIVQTTQKNTIQVTARVKLQHQGTNQRGSCTHNRRRATSLIRPIVPHPYFRR